MDKTFISNQFKTFATDECRGSCALYEHLATKIAEDDALLEICLHTQQGQPIPNLFFGAVHYLLLKGVEHDLKQFYDSMVGLPGRVVDSFPYFKDFSLHNRDAIISVLQHKLVQTNEVRRCSYLYPSFCYIFGKVKKPLALIEIGTSAGLQLLWDKYSYSYKSNDVFGNPYAEVHITSGIKGEGIPFLYTDSPPV